jgi:hypothetical protein
VHSSPTRCAVRALITSGGCFALGISTTTTMCFTNRDPDAGLPSSDAGFRAALQYAYYESEDIACVEMGGRWPVNFDPVGATGGNGPSGGTGQTGGTGVTGTTAPT